MENKVYTLDEDEQGLFSFEGKANKITLPEIRSLQELQPDSFWVLMTLPETYKKIMAEKQKNNYHEYEED